MLQTLVLFKMRNGHKPDTHSCTAEAASDADSTTTNASTEQTAPEASAPAQPSIKSPAQSPARPTQLITQSAAKPVQAAQLSLADARRLLDKDHYGLDKVLFLLRNCACYLDAVSAVGMAFRLVMHT